MLALRWVVLTVLVSGVLLPGLRPRAGAGVAPSFRFSTPVAGQLSLAGAVDVVLELPEEAAVSGLAVMLDGVDVSEQLSVAAGEVAGTILDVAEGDHELVAVADVEGTTRQTQVSFAAVALLHPDECEVLNNAECLLPFPSSRFLEAANTPTGWRTSFPAVGTPQQFGVPLAVEPYQGLDGFSPTVQILMHMPGGVDPAVSEASRLLPETRTYGLRSLDADSPTVLLDADTDERILHFIEPDIRAHDDPARQLVSLRPGKSLTPGHRYIVAARNLRHADGTAVEAEPAFAALRDRRPTDIDAIVRRREQFEDIFARLAAAGIARETLLLAFDFVVRSDEDLTGQMRSMRDQAFAWLAVESADGRQTFTVDRMREYDCSAADARVWRVVEGTYRAPLFLSADPVTDPAVAGFLAVDAGGTPVAEGFTDPPFTIAIPCAVLTRLRGDCDGDYRTAIAELMTGVRIALGTRGLDACRAFDADDDEQVAIHELIAAVKAALNGGGAPQRPIVLGHGLFGTGREFVNDIVSAPGLERFEYIAGGTDWRGLAADDLNTPSVTAGFVVSQIIFRLNNFAALPDRLRQGQLNTLLLGRMMKAAVFNADPAFQTPSGVGVFAGPDEEMYYFGASLGGIMGLMFAALSPDIEKANVDVPAMNFSLLLQRATPYLAFEAGLEATGITDPMQMALVLGLGHELWVRGESAGYATHITSNPLPGTNAKSILMTMAFLDQQVSNQATEIAARTLGLPSLEGSLLSGLPQIPDRPGPLPSALVVYDTGSFDLGNPAHAPFVPPLANLQPEPNGCDPHGLRAYIPASLHQLLDFLRPGGLIENFCNGRCDAGDPTEIPYGVSALCDPLTPGS